MSYKLYHFKQFPFKLPTVRLALLKTTKTLSRTSVMHVICIWKQTHKLDINHTGIQRYSPGQKLLQSKTIKNYFGYDSCK